MRKASLGGIPLLLFLGIIFTLFTFSTFGQCPSVSLTYPQEVPLNSTATLQASGCKGKVAWYLTDPNKEGGVLYVGNSLLYPISKETTFYAACQLEGGMPPNETLCQSSVSQATIKVGKTINSTTANISPASYFPPTPTAAAFARYGDIPVSNHTGLINQDIALYTIESKDVSLGLSLSNHGSGNKVSDVSSWVGLGMSLNAGGVLTRTVQGTPDEGQGNPSSTGYYARSVSASYYPAYINGQYSNTVQWAIPRPANYPNAYDCNSPFSQNFKDALDGKIDTEPDLFFFKIGEYSGKFMFDSLAVAHFLPEQDIKIEVSYNASLGVFEQFILTAPNGTKYYFGGTHGNNDFPQGSTAVEKTHTDPTFPVASGWYLTKIVSPDTQSSILLSYQSEQYAYFDLKQESLDYQSSVQGGSGWQSSFNPSQDFTKNRFLGVRLTNIYTSDKNTQVNFIADSLRKDVGEYTLGEFSARFSQAKYLNEIQILHGTSGIKRFVFKHDYFEASEGNVLNSFKPSSLQNNPSFYQSDLKRLRLKSVQEKSWDGNTVIPAYQFKYDSTISFPRRLCYSQDHWGYYNGNEYIGSGVNNSLMHIENGDGITGIPTAFLAGLSWHSNRSTNPAYIGFGALIKIVYPTNGYTVFEYGNHQRGSFAPSLNIGGLRIASISNYDADGTRLTKKRFDYLLSGILYTRPTYYYQALQISLPCGSGGNCFPAGCPTGIASSSTLLPLSSTQGSHIGYQQVKVLEVNASNVATNGYRVYTYNTDPPTIDVMNLGSYDDFGALRMYNYPLNPIRENYRQGTIALEEVLNSNDKLVHKISYGYQYSSKVVNIPAMKVDNHTIGNIPGANRYYNFYGFKTGRSELRSKTTTNCKDDGTDCVVSTETYEYSSPTHFQMTRMSQSSSSGDSLINTYKYSFDYTLHTSNVPIDAATYGIASLVLNHMIVPIEELNLLKSNGSIVVMGGELTQYNGISLKPSAKYLLEITNPFLVQSSFVPSSIIATGSQATFNKDSRYPAQANIAFLYNGFGNVAQIEQPQGSGLVRSFLWGYGGAFPIAEIKNATYASVQMALTSTVIDNLETSNNLSDAQIKSQLSPIWSIPNSLSSIYTYRPLRGVSMIMTSNQLNTSFFYDSLTRLSLTQDNENNKLTEYFYTYGTRNKITTKQYRAATTGILLANNEPNFITTHDYFDGLGRPIQQVGEQQSPQGKDIVFSTQTYDKYNRLSKGLTVFPSDASNGGYVSNGEYLAQLFYGDAAPYTNPFYENSPLNRLRSSFGLGSAWQLAGKKVQYLDESAGTDIKYYTVDGSGNITLTGTYPANSLYKKRLIDEQGNTSIEIKDRQGRLVQRQQQNGTEWLTTYYINDGLGRVSAILQPEAVALNSSISQGSADWLNGVFFYKYDTRGRLIESHVPNGGFTYSVYDKADRMVLSQDAHQATLNRWTFQKYDGLSRTILSGELPSNSSRNSLQSQFDSHTTLSEIFDSSKPEQLYYSNVSFPFSVDSSRAIEVNYYDNYNTWRKIAFEPSISNYNNSKGLLTGTRKRFTQNNQWLTESFYYDSKNRNVERKKENLQGSVERLQTSYRFFGGVNSHIHLYAPQSFGKGSIYYSSAYTYDFTERKISNNFYLALPSSINLTSDISYTYNEIGQLSSKKIQPNRQYQVADMGQDYINRPPALSEANTQDIANKAVIISPGFSAVAANENVATYLAEIDTTHRNGLTDAMQVINYNYHIRGQQNCINCYSKQVRIGNKENDLFSMKLDFEGDKRYYDGNISKQTWRNPLTSKNQVYKHFYDGASRLTKSTYSGGSAGSNYSLDTLRYSPNGNILQLKRHTIDNLSYNYNGNQLLSVSDGGTTDGFKDGNTVGNDYGYWANGSLKFDKNKGIDSIVYHSYLRKVSRVKFANGSFVNFYYDGAGTLLKRTLSNGDEWIYRDNLLIKNGNVYQITHDEGRAIYDSTAQKWVLEYDYRDHQGNLRLSFRDSLAAPINGVYAPPVITQITEQDPFGLEIKPLSYQNSVNSNNYKFLNRQDLPELNGVSDLVNRFYDRQNGRFWSTDPKIDEGQHSYTPYHYSFNNPVRFSDPDGLMGEPCCGDDPDGLGNGMTLVENIYWGTRDVLTSSIATIGTAFASVFSDVKPQRINATYSSGSRTLSAEVIPKGEVAQEVAMSTLVLATAVPSGGNAGTSMLMAKTSTKTSAASSVVKTVKEQALDIKKSIGNKHEVTVETGSKKLHYQLDGAEHKGVKTPHVQQSLPNTAPNGAKHFNKDRKWVEGMTQQDIRIVKRILKDRNQ